MLGFVFDRFLIDFWWILEGFWEPNWTKNRQKINVKFESFFDWFLDWFFVDLGAILAPTWLPKSLQNRWTCNLKTNTPKLWKLSSRWSESSIFKVSEALKLNKNQLKSDQQINQKVSPILIYFFYDFWSILGVKLEPSWHQNQKKWGTKTMSKNHQKLELQGCAGICKGAAVVRGPGP